MSQSAFLCFRIVRIFLTEPPFHFARDFSTFLKTSLTHTFFKNEYYRAMVFFSPIFISIFFFISVPTAVLKKTKTFHLQIFFTPSYLVKFLVLYGFFWNYNHTAFIYKPYLEVEILLCEFLFLILQTNQTFGSDFPSTHHAHSLTIFPHLPALLEIIVSVSGEEPLSARGFSSTMIIPQRWLFYCWFLLRTTIWTIWKCYSLRLRTEI